MAARQYAILLSILTATSLSGCSQTIDLYHDVEGGAIAKHRQPPPGAHLPYPNLADVPAVPQPAAANLPVAPSGLAASPKTLAGLALPTQPPPLPNVSGLTLSSGMASPPVRPAPVAKPTPPPPPVVVQPPGPPVAIGFRPGSALLPYNQQQVIEGFAAERGNARIRVCGFGGGDLVLALARARRMADALTAVGVPGRKIDMDAFAAGSGGFVQLVY